MQIENAVALVTGGSEGMDHRGFVPESSVFATNPF